MEGSTLVGGPSPVPDDVVLHRIGGGFVENLELKQAEENLVPPGISILSGGSPAEAAQTMRRFFPRMAPRGKTVVGSITVAKIREAGFDVIMDPTRRFKHHARLIHSSGTAGFNRNNLVRLAECFENFLEM